MPNGDPNWIDTGLLKAEAFFRKISRILEDFAESHNLMIDKYYHHCTDWTFRFRHPEGGVASICVRKKDDNHVFIYIFWHIDYYEANRRDYKHEEGRVVSLEPQKLRGMLTEAFGSVLSWKKEDLTKGAENPYREHKHKEMSKEEFERQYKTYPIPKFD